ncbi:SCO family protein [Coraliomargarita algicola]|uniref:SCO family protein n=1 Tax=Coraliomargarita algicola TaxID=3092156 RepID=A0ABZ0RK47_9BACT|nr:SCO family protein [Coraliomargarita sp. J2-16]WPJ95907.1 SCO family protein [Coraliomargarita sp. J2-16]
MRICLLSFVFSLLLALTAHAVAVQGRVSSVLIDERSLEVELTASEEGELAVGTPQTFRVGAGDLAIGYEGRLIKGNAAYYGKRWHLEQVFPLDGQGAKAAGDVNQQLHQVTAAMSRRKYVKQGEYIPNFAMIDQHGDFLQIRQLQGKPFVLNFIFTRCTVPTMCPASSTRMSTMQDAAREAGLEDLQFVTITFDPAFDSPGILKQYAEGYGMEPENFHLLTGEPSVVEDLLRQFGILTMDEAGTINHTMATLLVDAKGRVAYRKEGATWTTDEFLAAAKKL